jgi:hypothetical protein
LFEQHRERLGVLGHRLQIEPIPSTLFRIVVRRKPALHRRSLSELFNRKTTNQKKKIQMKTLFQGIFTSPLMVKSSEN